MESTAVYGPPGTGKTTWMMNKVDEFVKSGYSPGDIMYLSFTKAAAGEVLKRMGVKSSNTVSTIHSACYRLLNLGGAAVVDYRRLMQFGKIVGIPFKGGAADDQMETMEVGDMYLAMYSLARNRLTPFHEVYEQSHRPGSEDDFTYFVESYNSWRDSNGLIDFTDMLEQYNDDPRDHKCRIIFIDESQDLSPLQWAVIEGIVNQPTVEKVFIAGDDDQAIYEWAGADPHGMANFEGAHGASRIVLGQSYRVPIAVHEVVTDISGRIENRVDKEYKPRPAPGEVLYPGLFEPTDQSDGFILCRSHSIKQKVERALIQRRVPYLSEGGGLPGPFGCKAAKAIRAWKRYKDSGTLAPKDLEAMIASAAERVKGDLIAGDHKSILSEDPYQVFRMPGMFVDYFRDVDIHTQPQLTTMTIHASKGREANNVTVITDWTGRVEAGYVLNPDQEHRCWYVATSRAKSSLRIATMGEYGYGI